jgi:hypothetical protein
MKNMNLSYLAILFSICASSAQNPDIPNSIIKKEPVKAKFEPNDGECLFFIGQDLRAVGGLDNYTDGYCDSFDVPAGVTVYTSFAKGSESFGYIQKGNDGIKTIANWGAEDNCAQCYINDDDFNHSMIAIGLSLVGHEERVANGQHDDLVTELGLWIKSIQRPVFLRIGYEFDGWEWNNYNKDQFLASWKRIHSMFAEMEVNNVAFVWQSKGRGLGKSTGQDILEEWYPGDEFVDWCAYSYFLGADQEMLTFARKHGKPIFLAEATPLLYNKNKFIGMDSENPELSLEAYRNQFLDVFFTNPEQAEQAWNQWFVPFIKTLNDNKDVIKAFSYINVNWSIQPMWKDNGFFKHVDSRIQESDLITKKWLEEITKPRYLKPSPELWSKLKNN